MKASDSEAEKKRVLVTVDVEALPRRAPRDHVDRLIWGRFPDGEAGIRKILSLASSCNIPVTCFVDFCEHELYGDRLVEAARYAQSAGHDVQMHCHPEVLPSSFWERGGLRAPGHLQDRYDRTAADYFLSHFTGLFEKEMGARPVAYRAGSFRFNDVVLDSLVANGYVVSSNDCFETSRNDSHHTFGSVGIDLYRWSNGLLEVPISEMAYDGGHCLLSFPRRIPFRSYREFLDAFFEQQPSLGYATLLLHSWSLLQKNEDGHFVLKDRKRHEALSKLFQHIDRNYVPITMDDLATNAEREPFLTARALNTSAARVSVRSSKPLERNDTVKR